MGLIDSHSDSPSWEGQNHLVGYCKISLRHTILGIMSDEEPGYDHHHRDLSIKNSKFMNVHGCYIKSGLKERGKCGTADDVVKNVIMNFLHERSQTNLH